MLVVDGGSKHDPTDEIVGNPIHAFNLVKRFVVDWKKIENDLSKDDWKETAFKIKKRRLKTVLPKEDDLHQSAQVILTKPTLYISSSQEAISNGLSRNDVTFFSKACTPIHGGSHESVQQV